MAALETELSYLRLASSTTPRMSNKFDFDYPGLESAGELYSLFGEMPLGRI